MNQPKTPTQRSQPPVTTGLNGPSDAFSGAAASISTANKSMTGGNGLTSPIWGSYDSDANGVGGYLFTQLKDSLMARFGIVSGLLLCIDTAMALFGSLNKAPVFFIPMMLGIPILFFGVVALNPHRRRQALSTAALIGALGSVIGCGQLMHFFSLWRKAGEVNLHYTRIVSLMLVVCVIFSVSYLWTAFSKTRRNVQRSMASDRLAR